MQKHTHDRATRDCCIDLKLATSFRHALPYCRFFRPNLSSIGTVDWSKPLALMYLQGNVGYINCNLNFETTFLSDIHCPNMKTIDMIDIEYQSSKVIFTDDGWMDRQTSQAMTSVFFR